MNTREYILKTIKKRPLIIDGALGTQLQLRDEEIPKEAWESYEGCNELSLIPTLRVGMHTRLTIAYKPTTIPTIFPLVPMLQRGNAYQTHHCLPTSNKPCYPK